MFNVRWVHIPGERHRAADGLSRRELAEEDSDQTELKDDDEVSGHYIPGARPRELPRPIPIFPDNGYREIVRMTRMGGISTT